MNSCHLIGRLTQDPESRTTPSGKPVTTMRLAVPRPRSADSERPPVFVNVETWEGLATVCAEYLVKGRQVAIIGRLEHSEWTAQDGTSRQRHYVVAAEVEFLGARPDSAEAPPSEPEAPEAEEEPVKPKRRGGTRRKASESEAA